VGNKRDLEVQREVSLQEASQFAKENGKYAKIVFGTHIQININAQKSSIIFFSIYK